MADPIALLEVAWMAAADDLSIRVIPAGHPSAPPPVNYVVWVPDFARPAGAVVYPWVEGVPIDPALTRSRDEFLTFLGASMWSYDRSTFIECLTDWGWSGTTEPPGWYTDGSGRDPTTDDSD
jgi:hypothetical protein